MNRPWSFWTVAFVSAGLLAFEIGLFRILRVMSWHHYAFLVISITLLGFAVSGTALSLLRPWILPRSRKGVLLLSAGTAISIPLCAMILMRVPLEGRLVPALLEQQIAAWAIAWTLLAVPFTLGASAIGLALMEERDRTATLYAANLIGGAAGGVAIIPLMEIVPPLWIALAAGAFVLPGVAAVSTRARWRISTAASVALLLSAIVFSSKILHAWLDVVPSRITMDPYKSGAQIDRLVEQGAARRTSVAYSARGQVEVYESSTFHQLPFLGLGATPPAIRGVLVDGHWAGSQLDVSSAKEAAVMDHTLMAVPYVLSSGITRVLLLGEVGGTNVWLAARRGASEVHVVQGLSAIIDLGGSVFAQPRVVVHREEPRRFIDRSRVHFDLIQLVTLEGMAAGTGGVAGLAEDYLITTQGMRRAIERLAPEGLVVACRGIQFPPRDEVKITATMIAALRSLGITHPDQHLVLLRDYLGVCTILKASPWNAAEIARIRLVCRERSLTPVWFPGVEANELNHPDRMPGPPDEAGDWIHHAVSALLFDDPDDPEHLLRRWHFKVRPATDDSPFFGDFFKIRSIPVLRETFGEMWLTRTELGFLFVLAAILFVSIAGLILAVLPLWLLPSLRRSSGKTATTMYFFAIGVGYLLVEIGLLSRMTRLLGDSVLAAALVIPAFLLLSGLGSARAQGIRASPSSTAQGIRASPNSSVHRATLVLVVALCLGEACFDPIARASGQLPLAARSAVAVLLIAPAAFAMGYFMPVGLRRLHESEPALLPWAWGMNGFGSVLASPLAMAIGMMHGFRLVGGIALAFYLTAAVMAARLPAARSIQPRS